MPAGASPSGNSLRVLVVDDNNDAADTLALLLRFWGHIAETAYCGQAGIALAQTFEPQAIILDVSMPGIHGGQVAAILRQHPALAKALIVAATAYHSDDDRLDGTREH